MADFDQEQHVQEALRYLDQKDVKKVLRDLTESLLLRQPENPRVHMLEELWESTGRSWTPLAENIPCSFLEQKFPSPREAVGDMLRRAAGAAGVRRVSFFSAPNCRGRQVLGRGDASRFSGSDFLLVDSSDADLAVGQPGHAALHDCLELALTAGYAVVQHAVTCLIRSSEGVEGVLVAEPFPAFEATSLLPMMQLLALLLGERLTSMHWEAEARRSESVIHRLLQGVEVLAKPSEEWEKNLMQSAAEVPNEVLRGGVAMKDACVWQLDKRTYVDVCGQRDGHPTVLAEEAFTLSECPHVSCAEEVCLDSSGAQVSSREICVRLQGIGKPTILDFFESSAGRLDHFDLAAAEWLAKSSLRAALQARSQLQELILRKHSTEQMQSLVSELSAAANTLDFVTSVERAVQVVTHSKKCSVYFIDKDSAEVWSYPTQSVPESSRFAFGSGLPGRIAEFVKDNSAEQQGALVYNDIRTCPYLDTVPFGMEDARGIMVAAIKSAGKDSKPLGLILVGDKNIGTLNDSEDVVSAFSFWGSGKVEFTRQDSEFIDWLANAAGSHVERLSLDLMWTKALLERENDSSGGSKTMKKDDQELISEYFTAEAVNARSRGGTSQERKGPSKETATVHRFVGHVASALNFQTHATLMLSDADAQSVRNLTPAAYADVKEWSIDYWAMTPQDEITLLINSLHLLDVFDNVTIAPGVLLHFFQEVKASYRAIPFHNFHHGMSTLHYTFKMIQVAGLPKHLGHAEMFAMLMAALCHDVDHRGYNNAFEIMTRSELALRYNDSSPLENHHCARTFELALNKAECNFFQDLDQVNYNLIRKRMIAGILATDMKHHGQHVTILKEFEVGEDSESQSQFLVEVVLHAADISNPFMPSAPSQKWCACLNEEFSLQAEKEAELGLPVTSFMSGLREPQTAAKSLLGFIDFVIIPFTSSVFRIWPQLDEMRQFLDHNRAAAAVVLEEASNPGKKKLTTKRTWNATAPPAAPSGSPP